MLFPGSNVEVSFLYTLVYIVAMVMALFVAMPFHEFAHAAAAKREGDYTAVAYRRYTLAFHRHFDWRGFLFLLLFRFGWAKPVPIDERNFRRGKKSKFFVSIAGILANLILGTVFLFLQLLIYRFFPKVFAIPVYGFLLEMFLEISVSLNFMLVFFNLLPIYPLDGYKIVESFCKYDNKFLDFMKRYSFIIFLVVAFTGLYSLFYEMTAGLLYTGLFKLFTWILGF
ncbi:MAG: site-2 protease family protein [Clostridia bacterium]|nr:site-2 protease family protein [Clostridia bacterium]